MKWIKKHTTEGGKKTLLYVELCVFDTGIVKLRTFSLYSQINIYTKPDLKHSSLTHSLSLARKQTNTYIQRNGTERNETKWNQHPYKHSTIGPSCIRTQTQTQHAQYTRERERVGIGSEANEWISNSAHHQNEHLPECEWHRVCNGVECCAAAAVAFAYIFTANFKYVLTFFFGRCFCFLSVERTNVQEFRYIHVRTNCHNHAQHIHIHTHSQKTLNKYLALCMPSLHQMRYVVVGCPTQTQRAGCNDLSKTLEN